MKNNRDLIYSFIVVSALFSAPLMAADTNNATKPTPRFSAGPMLWYAWWSPQKYFLTNSDTARVTAGKSFSMRNSSIIYGPALSYRISDRWSMTAVFMFCIHGQYSAGGSSLTLGQQLTPTITRTTITRMNRYDADLTFGYSLNRYFRLFIGTKGQAFTHEGNYRVILLFPAYSFSLPLFGFVRARSVSVGAGSGVGVTVPLGAGFFFQSAVSVIAMPGEFMKVKGHLLRDRAVLLSYGGNATVSFAYVIDRANITISLGGRYQILSYALLKDDYSILGGMYASALKGDSDQFYGLLLSVLFSF